MATLAAVAAACQAPETYGPGPKMAGSGGTGGSAGDGGAGSGGSGALGGGGMIFGTGGTSADAGLVSTGGATGMGGALVDGGAAPADVAIADSGAGGTAGRPCASCNVSVHYTCLSDAPDQTSFVLNLTNTGTIAFLLADLTVRYWYTVDSGKDQEVDCDNAMEGCMRLVTGVQPVTPARTKANAYLQLGFAQGALDVAGSTGIIQLRLHNKDFSAINQADDYSFDSSAKGAGNVSTKITAYIRGFLVSGIEPS
ncbi:MAG TPA: cellulose binding domain-containing protein [Polyangia bacterium]